MNLVIVESPTKSKTISQFLGPKYKVLSSYGHIRDLPKSELGVDIEKDFTPRYIIPLKARKTVKLLADEVKKSQLTILATDEDREGEAIAWHLSKALKLAPYRNEAPYNRGAAIRGEVSGAGLNGEKSYQRIVFHEITKKAIEEALKNPRKIDEDLVDSQQARRILDRIVGYQLSPFLWKKIARGLSAGRVQSVAVRLVAEREREIQNFVPQEYWEIAAELRSRINADKKRISADNLSFPAKLVKKNDEIIPKLGIKNKEEAENIVKDLKGAEVDETSVSSSRYANACVYKIVNIEKKEIRRNPLPPFTTSTLQQEAWQRFRFPARLTMGIAQQLYEKGFITYHRTDSFNLSDLSLGEAKKFITKNYGQNYYQFRKYKTKSKLAQEAHEAIRPSYPGKTPESLKLDANFFKLYDIIWRRFISSQMAQAIFDSTSIDIRAKNYIFRATGQILKFDGFLKIYPVKFEEAELPPLKVNEILELVKLIPSQHFTQPAPRYNEATLIKTLEQNGIGRPSTYAPTLSTVQERNYIEKDENKRFRPTEIGFAVNDLLVAHFPEVVDINFTAKMEEDLDKIAEGKRKWAPTIQEFYGPFEKNLKEKYQSVSKSEIAQEKTEEFCPECRSPLLIRLGRFGKFFACSGFPKCRYTRPLEKTTLGIKCPKCQKGEIVEKRTKKRKIFYGCSNWPKCDFALWDKPVRQAQGEPTGELCPKCKSLLIETKRKQVKCSNKECDYRIER